MRPKGQKQHIIVDTLELVLCVVIQSASVQDRVGATAIIEKLTECRIIERTLVWLDTNRRTAKNNERYSHTSETIVHWSSIPIMLNHF